MTVENISYAKVVLVKQSGIVNKANTYANVLLLMFNLPNNFNNHSYVQGASIQLRTICIVGSRSCSL